METIEWKKGKPPEDGFYLVTTPTGLVRMDRYYTMNGQFEAAKNYKAWAEMPEPYKEKNGSNN